MTAPHTPENNRDLLDDYTKATFPYEVEWNGCGKVRLLGVIGGRVIGGRYNTYERDGETVECFVQSLNWDGQGKFSTGEHPQMDLPAPPAKVAEEIDRLELLIVEAQALLDNNPDAPAEWRGSDERKIRQWREKIARLAPPAALKAEPFETGEVA